LYPDTHYTMEIRAHNPLGYSRVSSITVKTARGSGDYPQWPDYREADIPIWIVVCAIVAILLVGFILVDLACFKINRQGITYLVCQRAKRTKKLDSGAKRSDRGSGPPGVNVRTINGSCHEKELLIDGQKPPQIDTVVVTNGKNGATKREMVGSESKEEIV